MESWRTSEPTSTSLSGACASDPTWSTSWKAGQLGHRDWFETGLVATYPKSPSQSCGKRIDRVPKRMAWSTMLWVVDWTSGHVEKEVMGILWVVTGNNVKWIVVEQLKRKLDVEERQIWSAELDDVDERNASCVVEGSVQERWDACPDGTSGIWIEMIWRPDGVGIELHVVQVEGHDAVVLVVVKDCVVVRGVDGVVVSMGHGMKQGPEEVHESSLVVDKEWTSPVGDMVWRLEVATGAVVVELELVEEALM